MTRNRVCVSIYKLRNLFLFFFALLFLFTWLSNPLLSLDPARKISQYKIKIWDMEGGLPANSVFALLQTRDGYLWIGTPDGLARFDGTHFELFNRKNIPQLRCNLIRALYQDRNDALWIGTTSGGLTCYRGGEFSNYPVTEVEALERISSIAEDRFGNLWIGSFTRGLTCFDGSRFTTYTTDQGIPSNQVRYIFKDKDGDLWVTTAAGIIKIMKPGVFPEYAGQDLLPYYKTLGIYEEGKKELWIGTVYGGLFRCKDKTFTRYDTTDGLPHLTVTSLFTDRRKNLWIGTDGGGLTRMKDGKLSTMPANNGLACGFVYTICEDREGSLWVGTLDGGLHQIRDSRFITYTITEGLVHNYVQCLHEDGAGQLWIGTNGGLSRMDPQTLELTTVLTTREGLLSDSVECIAEDALGRLQVGTKGGLHYYNAGKLTTLTQKDGLAGNHIYSIKTDRRGNTWIGTDRGLNRLDKNGDITLITGHETLPENQVQVIYEDHRGTLWFGTENGLNRYSGRIITPFHPIPGTENRFIICAYEDTQGTLWFGSESGLIRLREKESQGNAREIHTFTTQNGLMENVIYSILEDETGNLWLAGQNGISCVSKQELEEVSVGQIENLHLKSYNEEEGMKSRWCTGAACKTRDGRFWFPTSVGVAMIHPGQAGKTLPPPQLIIEKLIADGEIIKTSQPQLSPGKKRLEFYYTAASFINPRNISFKIKLEGYDSDWVDVGTARSTTYTGLAPGKYTFRVIAGNPNGEWNREGAILSFYLRPFFYQTPWFFITITLFIIFAIFTAHFIRVRHLRTREKELNDLVRLRTAELEEQSGKLKEMDKIKSRFFANISHEFRTPLTLIMGPLEQMLTASPEKEKEQKQKMRLMLRNTRRLLGLINRLLELSKFDSGTICLHAVHLDIIPFLKGIMHSFDSLAQQKELELVFQSEAEHIFLYFDPGKMEEVMANLLSNAVKFTPPGGQITLAVKVLKTRSTTAGQECVEISVSDTGPGIPPEERIHIFDRFYQADSTYEHHRQGTGIGLAIAREIVELHHGTIEAVSSTDETTGAHFIIRLPMGSTHLKPEEIADLSPGKGKPAPIGVTIKAPVPEVEPIEEEEIINTASTQEKDIILIVEDSADVREYIRGALEPIYAVVEAPNGEEGLLKAGEIVPDLIICDIMMPGMDGYALCRELKNQIATSHIPIVLLTAKASEESILEGLETGADDYLTKPFSTRILLARIKNLVDLRRHLQQTWNREMSLQPSRLAVARVDKEFIKDLKKVMDSNLSDPEFNVENMCKALYMGHTTLYRKIHALTGETPTDFIRSYRLKRGAELLEKGLGSVLEAALEVGFSSANYFTRCFKQKFHCLPSEYRASRGE